MRIAIGGDYALNDRLEPVGKKFLAGSPQPGLESLKALFEGCDFRILNFEGSFLEDRGALDVTGTDKVRIRATTAALALLRELGVDAVSLANNHSHDYGSRTRELVSGEGIACFGGGSHLEAAGAPLIRDLGGLRLGFIGWADRETIKGNWAGAESPGAFACSAEELLSRIHRLRREVDRLIFVPHWGRDYLVYPSPAMRELAGGVIHAGADAIVGTHPHVIGCEETIEGRPVVYSTGSLLLADIHDLRGRLVHYFPRMDSIVTLLELDRDPVSVTSSTFRCSRGTFRKLPDRRGEAALHSNSRVLHRPDYAAFYASYEAKMLSWGIRLRHGILSRPFTSASLFLGRRLFRAQS